MSTLIAICSQNRKTVTGHAGKCRKFWLYPVEDGAPGERRLVEIAKEETFHDNPGAFPLALEGISVMISQGMGQGMLARLARHDIEAWMSPTSDLDEAVQAYLRGEPGADPADHHHDHEHGHAHEDA